MRNNNFRRTSQHLHLARSFPLLSGFTISGLVGIDNYDFSLPLHKLILVGDSNTGKTQLLRILQLAFSGALFDHPELIEPYCNDKETPVAAITLRLRIPKHLSTQLKLLFICYTLTLRFDLPTITKESAKNLTERILKAASDPASEKIQNFSRLLVSYQVDSSASGKFLTITVSSGELLWLHERIPFAKNNNSGPPVPKVSADYALRDKFLFDSFIIKFIPMKKNFSFKASARSERAQSKPRPSLEAPDTPDASTADPLSTNKKSTQPEKKKEKAEVNSAPPALPDMPEHIIQSFSWEILENSLLKDLIDALSPLQLKTHEYSPFRATFQNLLSDSATFLSPGAFSSLPGGLARKNIVSLDTIEYFFEKMISSGSIYDLHQLKWINTGFKSLIGYSLQIQISLKRAIDIFLQLRLRKPSAQIQNLVDTADQLLVPEEEGKAISPLHKNIWHLIQLLIDREIEPRIVHKKFSDLLEQSESKELILDILAKIFQLPLFISSSSSVKINFINCEDQQHMISLNQCGSSFKQLLLFLACVHRSGGTCFIDQPEYSLSVQRQNQLRRYLMQQIHTNHWVVVTSSPNFLPEDCIQSTVFLREVYGKVSISQFLNNSNLPRNNKSSEQIAQSLLLDPETRSLLFASKVLILHGCANVRLVHALHSLVEGDPGIVDILERKLNSTGLALDIEQLLSWTVVDTTTINGIHPSVITFGYQIPSLVVASTTTAESAGQSLTRDNVKRCDSFQHILQVYGAEEQSTLLQDIFRDVEGLRGTLQQLDLQKAQQLREGEQSRLKELENQLKPELNILEAKLQTSITSILSNYGIYSWESGVGHMISKTPQAAKNIFSAWVKLPFSDTEDSEAVNDSSRAQQWLRSLESNAAQYALVWRNLPLQTIKSSIKFLIQEENEEFLHFCATLSRRAKIISPMPFALKLAQNK